MIGKTNIKRFISLHRELRDLDERIKAIKAKIAEEEKTLLERMTDAGVQRLSDASGATVYLHRQLWASKSPDVTDEEAAEVLRALNLGDMVKPKFNTNTMSAYIRELDGQKLGIPEELQRVLSITEKFSVRAVGI